MPLLLQVFDTLLMHSAALDMALQTGHIHESPKMLLRILRPSLVDIGVWVGAVLVAAVDDFKGKEGEKKFSKKQGLSVLPPSSTLLRDIDDLSISDGSKTRSDESHWRPLSSCACAAEVNFLLQGTVPEWRKLLSISAKLHTFQVSASHSCSTIGEGGAAGWQRYTASEALRGYSSDGEGEGVLWAEGRRKYIRLGLIKR